MPVVEGGVGEVLMGAAGLALVGAGRPEREAAALFEELLAGWGRQQLARRLGRSTILDRERVVRRFVEFAQGWPWSWREEQLEGWVAANRWAHSTVRTYQDAIGGFLDYVCDPRYGWVAECEQRVGAVPHQICHEWNTAVHVADHEGRPQRRPLSRGELQRLFDVCDEGVEAAAGAPRKGWLAAFRDATMFKSMYGWGLRRTETAMLDVTDFSTNPAAPQLGGLGVCHVRFGKAKRGSPPRRRAVATVMPWTAEALEQYLTEVRSLYGAGRHPAVWLTERGGRISPRHIDDRFKLWRTRAGLAAELSVHCLRHSYVSHLIEDGVDPLFVQHQVGHSWGSTTATYTTVGGDAKNRMLTDALSRVFDGDEQGGCR
jgi:integrase/recombinase XerC